MRIVPGIVYETPEQRDTAQNRKVPVVVKVDFGFDANDGFAQFDGVVAIRPYATDRGKNEVTFAITIGPDAMVDLLTDTINDGDYEADDPAIDDCADYEIISWKPRWVVEGSTVTFDVICEIIEP